MNKRLKMMNIVTGLISLFFIHPYLFADWSNWLGPSGHNVSNEELHHLDKYQIQWKKNIGFGYSGITTFEDKVIVSGHDGKDNEEIFCFSKKSGNLIWKYSFKGKLIDKLHAGGPNATALIQDKKVYHYSKDGQILCLSLETGKLIWKSSIKDFIKEKLPSWGYASSPQIYKNQLILNGGQLFALNPKNGKLIWVSKDSTKASYSSPVIFEVNNRDYAVMMTGNGFSIISINNGETLATYKIIARSIGATPLLFPNSEGEFFASTSTVSGRFRFDGKELHTLWTTKELRNKFSSSILIDDHIIGIDGQHKSKSSKIVCIDAKSGEMKWQEKRGHGTIIGAKNAFCFLSDFGELITFEKNFDKFKQISSKQILDEICWTTPTLSGGQLYARNENGDFICLEKK